MGIEDKIRQIAEDEFPEYSYIFEDWNAAAEVADRVLLPAIICILPVGGHLNMAHGMLRDSEDLALAFVDKVARDANGDDNEAVYTRMKAAAARFLYELDTCRHFEPLPEKVRYTTIYESASAYYTGVFVELTLEERRGTCL